MKRFSIPPREERERHSHTMSAYRHYPYQIPSLFCRRESACKIPFCFLIIYDRNFTISSSTVLIPPIPNCSINTFLTFGERKAGSVGPK